MLNRNEIIKENRAYAQLVAAGFLPQGYDFKTHQVVIIRSSNPNTNNEERTFYYFPNWSAAAASLLN